MNRKVATKKDEAAFDYLSGIVNKLELYSGLAHKQPSIIRTITNCVGCSSSSHGIWQTTTILHSLNHF